MTLSDHLLCAGYLALYAALTIVVARKARGVRASNRQARAACGAAVPACEDAARAAVRAAGVAVNAADLAIGADGRRPVAAAPPEGPTILPFPARPDRGGYFRPRIARPDVSDDTPRPAG